MLSEQAPGVENAIFWLRPQAQASLWAKKAVNVLLYEAGTASAAGRAAPEAFDERLYFTRDAEE
jgi:hypothetical protein